MKDRRATSENKISGGAGRDNMDVRMKPRRRKKVYDLGEFKLAGFAAENNLNGDDKVPV
jgi:hypothetical protein